MDKASAATLLQEGLALHRASRRREAMERYHAALRGDPDNPDALYYLALIGYQDGRLDDCIGLARTALAKDPQQARTHYLLGSALSRAGRHREALPSLDQAIALAPDHADAHGNRGNVLADLGRPAEALTAYDSALKLRPDSPEDWCNRGNALADLDRLDEAVASLDRAIALDPSQPRYHFNRANVRKDQDRLHDALAGYDRALALDPRMAEACTNSGFVLRDLGRIDEALARLDRAAALQPDRPESFTHRGNALRETGQLDAAAADYRKALALDPRSANAHVGLGLTELARGNWRDGWQHYEHRERLLEPAYQPLSYPRWRGEPLDGERLVLLAEQGLGDIIQFGRFAPLLASHGYDVTLLTRPTMRALMSSLAGVGVATSADTLQQDARPIRWCSLMSAPGLLGIEPAAIPGDVPYLSAEPARTERWGARLGSGFNIGIVWASGPSHDWYRKKRDIPLAAFAPLAALPHVRLISLQKGAATAQIAQVAFRDRIETPGTDPYPDADFFLDTAALMMSLDLVVTCDTSIAHLAGALGRPVFVALPPAPDWRWGASGEASPWYPTMRLFRQARPNDWAGSFDRIAEAVRALM